VNITDQIFDLVLWPKTITSREHRLCSTISYYYKIV